MLTQLIRKISQRLPIWATETDVPISFHHGQTRFISTQLHNKDNLRDVLETIVQNLELNFAELYVVIELIPQP